MASNTATVGTLATILFIIVILITAFSFIGDEINSKVGSNLDSKSLNVINTLNSGESTDYNRNTFNTSNSTLTQNSSFVNVDPYSRQYLEDKGESVSNQGVINKIIGVPNFLYDLIGLEMPPYVNTLFNVIGMFLGFIIGLALYKFLKGEVD